MSYVDVEEDCTKPVHSEEVKRTEISFGTKHNL